jgi:hypothetical protein
MKKNIPIDDRRPPSSHPEQDPIEVAAPEPIQVRETSVLFRLRSGRFVAAVAADTEVEARDLAARQDLFGVNWRDPNVASAESEEGDRHVFGDVTITATALPAAPTRRRKPR